MKRYRNKAYVRQMTSDYYGLVAEVDHWVGRILAKLDELGLAERTLVIFTSDHGEMLGDHGMHSKMVFYDGAAHIPLLMRLPGAIAGGTVVTKPVSHVDLFATILDYLHMPARRSEGRSLRKLIADGRDDGPEYCVSEWRTGRGPTLMIRTKDFKLITTHVPESPAVDALYDLRSDPQEMNNLIAGKPRKPEHVKQARAMKRLLVEWLAKIGSPRVEGLKARRM